MTETKTPNGLDRRGFLKTLGTGAGAAAAVAAPIVATPAGASESDSEKKKARYQGNSAHVQAFYKTNRY